VELQLDVLRCGICGSDLHARNRCDEVADVMAETGYPDFMRSNRMCCRAQPCCTTLFPALLMSGEPEW
jgi:hypothetical protein